MRNSIRFSSGDVGLALGHAALDLNGAAHSVHNARELRQEAIASVLHNPAPVLVDLRVDQLPRCALSRSCVPSSSAPIRRE